MDDQFYKKQVSFLMKDLINSCEKICNKIIRKKNIGNPKKFYRYKNFYYTVMNYF